ncbi:substrate-binding domain-containing protein [Metaclostridioides mangenotii]|uniref:substrate-binding domain-containing protein n=1 Tax=Metaclostridioides mangenotii TaxID=1540 RepID=UPI0004658C01|nr:helix-turn-helix transcriptional regulator [Clostridioides mangenotii]
MEPLSSLTPAEVADLLKITKNTVYEMIKRGEIPSYKIGKKIRIDTKDVKEYIESQKTSSIANYQSVSKTVDKNISFNVTNSHVASSATVDSTQDIIISGQDVILDILARYIDENSEGVKTFRSYIGSYNALIELYNNKVSIASAHLWDYETNEYNTTFVKKLLPAIPCVLINLACRTQGFYVAKGNPKNINTWEDLTRQDVFIINREKGSGTRILLDGKMRNLNVDSYKLNGYKNEENSHLGIASAISRGLADVGIGNEKAALQVSNIDFIPIQIERYDLVIKKEDLLNPVFRNIVSIINSDEFKSEIEGLGGYDLKFTGKIVAEA